MLYQIERTKDGKVRAFRHCNDAGIDIPLSQQEVITHGGRYGVGQIRGL